LFWALSEDTASVLAADFSSLRNSPSFSSAIATLAASYGARAIMPEWVANTQALIQRIREAYTIGRIALGHH
jgi:hypothetical protein